MLKLLVVFAVFVACNALEVNKVTRNGQYNVYNLYTRSNSRRSVVVGHDRPSVNTSPILRTRDTVVIIHGHEQSAETSVITTLKNAFLTIDDHNVIVVDWSLYAGMPLASAISSAVSVGNSIGEFLGHVVAANKAEWSRIHIIGLGIGAHIAGIAGKSRNGNIAKITGLDPAGGAYDFSLDRLNQNDAQYVEIIHTDSEGEAPLGTSLALGHVDFYVNKGGPQPGCDTTPGSKCNQERSVELLAASIVSDPLVGHHCTDMLQLASEAGCTGYRVPLGTRAMDKYAAGIYAVESGCVFPYHDECSSETPGENV